MEAKEKIIAQLGKAVVVLGSLCIVLAVIIVVMLNSRYHTDVEIAISEFETPLPPGNPTAPVPPGHEKGYMLFKQNCAVCHSLGKNVITGPGMADVMDRVPSEEWLYKWIKNADAVKKSGDDYAVDLDKEYAGNMSPFTFLSEEEIGEIIKFLASHEPQPLPRLATVPAN